MFTSAGERSAYTRRYSGGGLARREADNVTRLPSPSPVMGRSWAAHPYCTTIAGTVTLNPVICITS
jgi:hypothetical protein